MGGSVSTRISRVGLFCISMLAASTVSLSAESKRRIDIDSGEAGETLLELSLQTELSIVFNPKEVEEITTAPVKGDLFPSEALARMLDGTGLTFDEDVETGAFAVVRFDTNLTELSGGNPIDPTNANPNQRGTNKLNNKKTIGNYFRGLFALAVASTPAFYAQDDGGEDEIFELSPFTVDSSDDVGYRATTTLAGSRLKMKLKDVGAAVSVMTEELMDDTGATDAGTLLSYGLSTEVASGDQGNYSAAAPGDGSYSSISTRKNPQSAQRIRGLASATLTRDYFLTSVPFDKYNTSAITINRGPNSLLFGIGSPGGVINSGVKDSSLGMDFGEVEARIGERGSYRASIDYNKVILEDRLSLRVSLLESDTQFQQNPAYEEVSRHYFALNAKLAKNENVSWLGATNLRANYEGGEISGTPVDIVPMRDGISSWFGLPDNWEEIVAISGMEPAGYADGYERKWTVDNHEGTVPIVAPVTSGFWEHLPVVYTDPTRESSVGLPDASVDGVLARVFWGRAEGDPGWSRADNRYSAPYYSGSRSPGFSVPNIVDTNVYDNRRVLLAGTSQWVKQNFDVKTVRLEQSFLQNKAGIELAFNAENFARQEHVPFYSRPLMVDGMTRLNNGMINPNVGRPLIMDLGTDDRNDDRTNREAYQATAFYELDLEGDGDGFRKFFGRHIFTGFLGSQQIDNTGYVYRSVMTDLSNETDIQSYQNNRVHAWRRNVPTVVYLGPSMLGSEFQSLADVRLENYFHGSVPQPGDIVTEQYQTWTPTWKGDEFTEDLFFQNDFLMQEFLRTGSRSRREIDSEVFSVQNRWFGGNIVSVFGWRSDEMTDTARVQDSVYDTINPHTSGFRFASGALDSGSLILSQLPEDISTQSGDTFTSSVVAHVPQNWLKLPYNSQLSVHYNKSENFSASGVRRNVYGEIIPAPTGETKDFGFTLSTLEDRLSLRFNWFETSSSFSRGPSVSAPGWISNGMNRWRDAETGGMTFAEAMELNTELTGIDVSDEFSSFQDVYDEALRMLPQPVRDRWEGWDENGAGKFGQWTPNPGQATSQDFVSEGFELDVAGSLTTNWTVAFNVAKQETITSNVAPVGSEFVFAVADNLANSPLGLMIDSPNLEEDNWWSNRWANNSVNPVVAALAAEGKVSPEQRKWRWNLVSNYSFTEGALKGVQVGGALRWQDKIATGYRVVVENSRVTPLIDSPFFGESETNGDIWVKYGRKILDDKVDWVVQLNVRNLYRSNSDFIPIITNPDGRHVVFRNPNPEEVYLTNTFKF